MNKFLHLLIAVSICFGGGLSSIPPEYEDSWLYCRNIQQIQDIDQCIITQTVIPYGQTLQLSPDGNWIAYTVQERPEENYSPLDGDITKQFLGSYIRIQNILDQELTEIRCNGTPCWSPSWSPNGKHVAFYTLHSGQVLLGIYNLITGKETIIKNVPIALSASAWLQLIWNPDGKSIYITGQFTEPAELPPTNNVPIQKYSTNDPEPDLEEFGFQIIEYTLATQTQRTIVSEDASFLPVPLFPISRSPSGTWILYGSESNRDGSMTEKSGALVLANAEGHNDLQLLVEGISRDLFEDPAFAWNPAKDQLAYAIEGKLFLLNITDNGPTEPRKISVPDDIQIQEYGVRFTQDGQAIIVQIAGNSDSFLVIDINDMTTEHLSLPNPWKLRSHQLIPQSRKQIVTSAFNPESGECALFGHAEFGTQSRMLWKGIASLNSLTVNQNNGTLYCIYEDIHTPQSVRRFDPNSSRWIGHSVDPDLEQLSKVEYHHITTEYMSPQGERIQLETAVVVPKGTPKNANLPAVVLFYPGSNCSKVGIQFRGGENAGLPVGLLIDNGYAVILPDIPLGPEGKPGEPVQEILDALHPQMKNVIASGCVDPERLAIMGHSYGGYGTAAVLSGTDIFSAGIAFAGVYDLAGSFGELHPFRCSPRWALYGQGRMGVLPWEDLDRYIRNSPYHQADKIQTPLLLIHGGKDQTCKPYEAERMFCALKELGKKAELLIYPEETHSYLYWSQAAVLDMQVKALSFLNENL